MDRQNVWWKRMLHVQAPYRWKLRREQLGRTLDVGCGTGRNLAALQHGSVGVDHNATSVAVGRELGHPVMTVTEFESSAEALEASFDSLLLAHVLEHMERDEAVQLVKTYLPYVRPGGKVMFVCPQERGYRSDPTHVHFCNEDDLREIAADCGLKTEQVYSFPFPRLMGRLFVYNEFNLVSRVQLGPEPQTSHHGGSS